MSAPGVTDEELDTLLAIKREYSVTVRVLAVVIELLLAEVGGDTIEISDDTLANSPDLKAERIAERNSVAITTTRQESTNERSNHARA